MENEYSVVTSNKYNLFLDEDEPSEILQSLKETKAKKKDEKPPKGAKTEKSRVEKVEKTKGSKTLTSAEDHKPDSKPKTDEHKADGQHTFGEDNKHPQSARENQRPRRQTSAEHKQQSEEHRERRPQQGRGFGPNRPFRRGGEFRDPASQQLQGDNENSANGGGKGSFHQRDRPPRDDRRVRGRQPPRRGERSGFEGRLDKESASDEQNSILTSAVNGEKTESALESGRRPPREGDSRPYDGEAGEGFGERDHRRGGIRGYRRGGRGGRGFGGGRGGFDRFGKREFERHSGNDQSGVKHVDKRAGGGSHNWGNSADDDVEGGEKVAAGEGRIDKAGQKEGETVAEADVAAAAEGDAETGREAEDDKEMTYAEYKAQLAKQRTAAAQPQFNVRKANEGHEDATWKKMVPLKKEHLAGEEETGGDEQQEREDDDKHGGGGRGGKKLDIEFTLPERHRDGGGRGRGEGRQGRVGRGGSYEGRGRGGRGRTYYEGGRGSGGYSRREPAPKFDDADFPALS